MPITERLPPARAVPAARADRLAGLAVTGAFLLLATGGLVVTSVAGHVHTPYVVQSIR